MWRLAPVDIATVDTRSDFRWVVAAPFFTEERASWIVEDGGVYGRHSFAFVRRESAGPSWHEKARHNSSVGDWLGFRNQAREALGVPSDGCITVFPQLAAAAASQMRVQRDDRPLVSWFFNTTISGRVRARSARAALGRVNRFVVHSTAEIEAYARDLALPADRFQFVPLQYGGAVSNAGPPPGDPYLFATGSGFRDYGTMFAAVEKLGYRTLVLAGPRALAGLEVPDNVEIIDAMSKAEIHRHVLHARANVLPLNEDGVTAGLVTIVEAFRHGRAMVGTARSGVEDYLIDDDTALLAPPFDVNGLADRLEAMWTDESLRERLDHNADRFGQERCTDTAAAAALGKILDQESGMKRAA